MDSKLVVFQMAKKWRVKQGNLVELNLRATRLAAKLGTVRYEWIPRDQNNKADWLANRAMDGLGAAKPPSLSSPVTVRTTTPLLPDPKPYISKAGRRNVPINQRLRETAALAVDLGVDLDTIVSPEVAAVLVNQAPDRLRAIWDNLPSTRWLSGEIAKAVLRWPSYVAEAAAQEVHV